MKLRNKKTGEAVYVDFQIPLCNNDETLGSYSVTSLEALNRSFEDYKPTEPLIKDKKIRKAIRAWAEANNANVVSICALSGGWGVKHGWVDGDEYYSVDLLFKGHAPLGVGNHYTIEELCGEEKE